MPGSLSRRRLLQSAAAGTLGWMLPDPRYRRAFPDSTAQGPPLRIAIRVHPTGSRRIRRGEGGRGNHRASGKAAADAQAAAGAEFSGSVAAPGALSACRRGYRVREVRRRRHAFLGRSGEMDRFAGHGSQRAILRAAAPPGSVRNCEFGSGRAPVSRGHVETDLGGRPPGAI